MTPTYPERTSSGVESLGEIPSHWTVTALKRILSEPLKYGATEPGDESDPESPRYLRITDFDGDGSLRADTFVSLPEEIARHYYLRDGDVLFARSGATVGKTFLFRNYSGRACFAGYLIKASTARHKLTPEFLAYFTRSPAYDAWKDSIFTQATIQNIGADKYARLPICLPPLPEQQRIAAYLDASCAAIDAAVAAKRRQLETLEDLRKSVIHSIFADHGGAVIERVKDVVAKITSGVTPDGGSASYLDSGIPLLRSQNVHFEGLRLDDVAYISEETHAGMKGSQLMSRDVLLNITGASIGRCTFVPDGFGEGNVNQHVCVIRPGPCIDHRFLAAFLSASMGQDQILSTFTGASRQGLSHGDLGLIRLPLPKIGAQREIVAKIEHHDLKHRSLYCCIETQIDTLAAYRKSLIHECVTGQRRVTEADVKRVKAHGV
jgi:type I restriction enzyme S subunit